MSEKICGVYQILNTVNGDCYIGSSVNIKVRWSEHKRTLRKSNNVSLKLQRAWDKYGENSFKFNILEIVTEGKGELYKREQYYIDVFDSVDNGYNICVAAGSRAGLKSSEKTKEKISMSMRGENNHNYGNRGERNPNYGRKHTEESKEKMSQALKGKSHSEQHREKLSVAHTGKVLSQETRLKMSEAHKGEKNHNYRKSPSLETRCKMSKAHKGKQLSEETKAKRAATRSRHREERLLKTTT